MSKKFKIGIDYGGTKIEGILLDDNGLQIERKRYSYEKNYLFTSIHHDFFKYYVCSRKN